jgi:carbon-monoxide dehydrogenase medium subunit
MVGAPTVSRRLKPFEYVAPLTIQDALSALDHDPETTRLLAGGTDLLTLMKLGLESPERIVSLRRIPSLNEIRPDGSELRIGALTSIHSVLTSSAIAAHCLALHEATTDFATPQIRHMATIGGNVCRSSPSADTVPPLLALDAELRLEGPQGTRTVALEEFFTGAGSNVLDREILSEIRLRLPERRVGSAYTKFTRTTSDCAKVSCAVAITVTGNRCEDVRIVLGAVAERPTRAKLAEQILREGRLDEASIDAAARKVAEEISPITDVRSTASCRSQVSMVLTRRMIALAIERAT